MSSRPIPLNPNYRPVPGTAIDIDNRTIIQGMPIRQPTRSSARARVLEIILGIFAYISVLVLLISGIGSLVSGSRIGVLAIILGIIVLSFTTYAFIRTKGFGRYPNTASKVATGVTMAAGAPTGIFFAGMLVAGLILGAGLILALLLGLGSFVAKDC